MSLTNLPFDVFPNAYVDTGVYVLSSAPCDRYLIHRFPKKAKVSSLADIPFTEVASDLSGAPDWKIVLSPRAHRLLRRMSAHAQTPSLGELTISTQGLHAGRFRQAETQTEQHWWPFLASGQVYRYQLQVGTMTYVSMADHENLTRFYGPEPKLLVRRLVNRSDRLMATYTEAQMVCTKDVNPFVVSDASLNACYLLGVFNSRLISYVYVNTSSIATKDDFRQTTLSELRSLPIRTIDFDDPDDVAKHDRMVELVGAMLEVNKRLQAVQNPNDRKVIERQIAATDTQIDSLVYELYELTDEEIAIVEEATE